MTILILAGLSDKKLASKLLPMLELESISQITLFRRKFIDLPGINCISPPQIKWLPKWISELCRINQIFWYLLKNPVNYIVCFQYWPQMVLGHLCSAIFQKKLIPVFTGNPLVRSKHFFFHHITRKAYKIGVRGTQSKAFLIKKGISSKKIYIIPNYFLLKQKDPLPTDTSNKKYDLLFAGNLIPVKRPDLFIKIVAKLKKSLPNIRVAIAGKGIMREKLVKQVEGYGLKNQVFFMGHVQNFELLLKQSRCLVMTSASEGLPMAMIEAMSMGLPCIVPNVGDITDIAEEYSNARIIVPHNLKSVAAACEELLTNEPLYRNMAGEAKKKIQSKSEEYSLAHIAKLWEEILK